MQSYTPAMREHPGEWQRPIRRFCMDSVRQKRCPRCGGNFPVTNEFFYRNKSGFQHLCKPCHVDRNREWFISKGKKSHSPGRALGSRSKNPETYKRFADPKDRFWKFIARDCWTWTGAKIKDGYGGIKVDGKMVRAHRFSWALHFGEIPEGMMVCHKCDNRLCVNPDHLFLAPNDANVADMVEKGRNLLLRLDRD